ncbi:MAG: dihydrolipoyllysine-residue acetyltransferase [Burkholderiales bacterium]|nr:dihydrolipoyllysine-residue acetyltransferase [Burkholderiales bacterium]
MALVEVKVPDIGDFKDVAVIEVLVKPGDTVKLEQSLITVESDKASMEIPSSHAGVVKELKVNLGDTVNEGSLLLTLEAAGEAATSAAPPPAPAAAPSPASAPAPVAVAAPAAAAGGLLEVRVPDIGDFKDVAVIEVLVKPGDAVKMEQSLITVESDKASMEIPSSQAGVLKELKVKLGDTINQGDLLAVLEGVGAATAATPSPSGAGEGRGEGGAAASSAAPASVPAPSPQPSPASGRGSEQPHDPTKPPLGLPHASPSVRKFARELGVPLGEVKGSGPRGRITQEDVQAFTRAVMAGATRTQAQGAASAGGGVTGGGELNLIPWPKVDFARFGPIERKEMSRIKKISGANLMRNAVMIPAVTNHDDADITDLEAFRVSTNKENEKSGVKVTMLAFLIKACVAALKKFPEFNSSLDGDALVYKQFWHIGFAADTPNGLMVPVIKDADQKGVLAISQEMGELAKKARDGKLSPAEMSGATFTISSLGGIGGRYFTPIINAPEVAILGVCRSTTEPVWDGKQFQPRLMLPLSLTWDHRVIDGAAAARFNAYLGQILGDFRRVLL